MKSARLFVALVLCSCSPAAAPTSAATSPGTGPGADAAKGPIVSSAQDRATIQQAQRRVADFLDKVAAVRHLPARAPVKAEVLDRAQLIDSVRRHVSRELPRDVIRNQGELLSGFGLVPPDYDYEAGAFRLLESQLAGFYEPSDKKMYLAADLPDRAADATLSHELVHALQDQYYDLGARLSYQAEANDRASAVQALAEGDATSAMMDLMLGSAGKSSLDVPDDVFAAEVEGSVAADSASVPRVLRDSLVAPYVDGVMFVNALRRRGIARSGAAGGGWNAVDEAWRAPPQSTEQVLHLSKYDSHETPEAVDPPVNPKGSWSVAYGDVFGEEGLRIVAEEWVPRKSAAAVAQGWAGDRAVLFRSRGPDSNDASSEIRLAVAWRVRFDTAGGQDPDAEAKEAFKLLSVTFGAPSGTSAFCRERADLGPLVLARGGRDIVLLGGPYKRTGPRVRADAVCKQSLAWAADILVGHTAVAAPGGR